MTDIATARAFYGWVVVAAAFVVAVFGWGIGFYGPPIYLKAVQDARGWSVSLVSAAFGVIREATTDAGSAGAPGLFLIAGAIQVIAALIYASGRDAYRRRGGD